MILSRPPPRNDTFSVYTAYPEAGGVPKRDLHNLDAAEGVSSGHYFRKKLEIGTDSGAQTAVCYIACDDKVAEGLTPEKEYIDHILCGCDLLGEKLSDAVSKVIRKV